MQIKQIKMRKYLSKYNWILSEQLGVNLQLLVKGLIRLPGFAIDYWKFKKKLGGNLELMPCLHDKNTDSGNVRNEYFWQDLIVAKAIFKKNPHRHVDIGSRVDGFIAHVASFREIEVIDIRALPMTVPNVIVHQADLMSPEFNLNDCDSLSCLHALEHFGLGRYGDPIDPDGWKKGILTMSMMLSLGGRLYLGVPVGRERVVFNAHRIFSINTVLKFCSDTNLQLKELMVIKPGEGMLPTKPIIETVRYLSAIDYALAIMTFEKI